MALVVKDRVKETTATTGTGTLTLAGAVAGFQTFTSVLSNGDTTYYGIFESSTGEFEVGLGTFTSSGTTLARTTILESSNSGNAVNLTAGAADVFITQPAEKAVYLDASGYIATADGRNLTNVDAATVDSLDSTQFLRSDAADTATGVVTFDNDSGINVVYSTSDTTNITGYGIISNRAAFYLRPTADNSYTLYVGGSDASYDWSSIELKVGNNNNVNINGNTVWHAGNDGSGSTLDADLLDGVQGSSYLRSDADDTFTGTLTVSGSAVIDDITINGSTISDGADLTVDVGGVLNLDAATQIILKDEGTNYGTFYQSSNDFGIQSLQQDKDIVFFGNDGGSGITALRLDMSDAGTATFNHDIKLGPSGGDVFIYYNGAKWLSTPSNAKYLSIGDSGSNAWDGNTGVKLMFGSSDVNAINGYYIGTNLENYGGNYNKLDIDYATGIRIKADKQYGGTRFYDVGGSDALILSVGTGNSDVAVANNLSVGADITVAANIYHEGDTDTKIVFGTNTMEFFAGGVSAHYLTSTYTNTSVPFYNYAAYFDESSQLTGTTPTCNAAASGVFYLTMSGNTTFTFTNTSANWGIGFILYLTGNGSTVTWPNSVDWAGGTAPDAPANGETDILVFHTRDGSNWVGALAVDAAA